jgi:hypothetical protein
MDPNELRQLVDLAGQHANAVLIGLNQPLIPSWLYLDRNSRTHVVATPWTNDQEKEHAARHMRWVLRTTGARAYSLVTEAWVAMAPAGWKPGQDLVRPGRSSGDGDCLRDRWHDDRMAALGNQARLERTRRGAPRTAV